MNVTYFRYEFLRLLRNKRFFFFSLVFPLVLFLIFGVSNKNSVIDFGDVRLKFILFYMVGMAGYGARQAGKRFPAIHDEPVFERELRQRLHFTCHDW